MLPERFLPHLSPDLSVSSSPGCGRLGHGPKVNSIPISSRDEVGELTTAFNDLAANLSRKTVSLDYFASIINSMNEMLFVLGIDAKRQTNSIIEVNRAALAKLGYQEDQLLGSGVENFFWMRMGKSFFPVKILRPCWRRDGLRAVKPSS